MSENLSFTEPQARPAIPQPMLDSGFAGMTGNRLLARLPDADFELLARYLGRASFDKGSVLEEPGQAITRAYFLESGLVSLPALLPDGHADLEPEQRQGEARVARDHQRPALPGHAVELMEGEQAGGEREAEEPPAAQVHEADDDRAYSSSAARSSSSPKSGQ